MKRTAVRFVMVTVFLMIATGFSVPVGRWENTSAAPSVAFPQGTYVTELTRGDIPTSFPPGFVDALVGRWETTLAENGRHTVAKEGRVVVEGEYAATQNQISFSKDKGPQACDIQDRDPRFPAGTLARAYPGTYNWAFDGKMLTFTKVADECAGRVIFFTAHPLARREAAQVPDDKLIVPGQRIGKWTLEMTIANLTQMNGPATTIGTLNLLDIVPPPPQRYDWEPLGFAAITRDRQRVEFFLVFSPTFKTEKGVGPGSDRIAVQTAYGPPTAETRAGVTTRMIYDAIGFAANLDGDRVVGSNVFRPGTGKSIWTF